jgi:hypothetical protein
MWASGGLFDTISFRSCKLQKLDPLMLTGTPSLGAMETLGDSLYLSEQRKQTEYSIAVFHLRVSIHGDYLVEGASFMVVYWFAKLNSNVNQSTVGSGVV